MAADLKADTRPGPLSIDLLTFFLFSNSAISTFFVLYPGNFQIPALYPVVLVVGLFFVSIIPLLKSSGIKNPQDYDLPAGVILRRSNSRNMYSLDSIVRQYIMIPSWVLEYKSEHIRAQVHHELSHLLSGDARYFHLILPMIAVNLLLSTYGLLNYNNITFFAHPALSWSDALGRLDGVFLYILVGFILVVQPIFLVIIMILTVRDREYHADYLAITRIGDRYISFLKSMETGQRYRRSNNLITRFWNRITHPSFTMRLASTQNYCSNLYTPTFFSGFLCIALWFFQASNFVVALVGYITFQESSPVDQGSPLSVIFIVFLLVMGILAIESYTSILMMGLARNATWREFYQGIARFGLGVSVASALCALPFWINNLFSLSSRVDDKVLRFYFTIPISFLLSAIVLAHLWRLVGNRLGRLSYNWLIHLAVGWIVFTILVGQNPIWQLMEVR